MGTCEGTDCWYAHFAADAAYYKGVEMGSEILKAHWAGT